MLNTEIEKSSLTRENASSSVRGLDLLQTKLPEDERKKELEPDEIFSSAVNNLHFVNETISPLVKDYYELTKKRLQFGYRLGLSSLSPAGIRLITYNYPQIQNRLGIVFAPGRRPAELTESIIARLYSGINPDAVAALGKLSKKDIIEKFKNHIAPAIK